ncbi:MAG: hypothetical protein FK730_10845 [Asgard group archaeon]|nr:hypothetical protein [Asgard group archaeon]
MKKWRIVIVIGVLLSFLVNQNYKAESYIPRENPLQSNITKVEWRSHSYYPLDEDHSHFEFVFYFDILNPTNEIVTLEFDAGCYFSGNIVITFYERSYNYYNSTKCGQYQVVVERSFNPGITKENVTYMLSFEKKGLTVLPDGLYEMWVSCLNYGEDLDANHITIEIRNEHSLNLSIDHFFLGFISVTVLALIISIIRYRKNLINAHLK